MVCLDTDFLIAYLRDDNAALKKLEGMQSDTICTTVINAFELYKGVYRTKENVKELYKVKELLNSLELLALDDESAEKAGKLDADMKSNSVGESDLLIASIVLKNSETLLTRNVKHFERVHGLAVESW